MENNIQVGSLAPDFTLPGSDGSMHTLSQYRGKKVILYFYPRDNTPGCSREAEAFRDAHTTFSDNNTVILGVSRDTLASHEKFITKFDLPFVLLSDKEETVCKLYDVLKEKNMYGKKCFGIERSTFIIDEEGKVTEVYRKVKVPGHVDAVQCHLGF
ncbi:MAG: peroxiredoxin [Cellulosilyticaceae bacterium]